MKDPVWSKQRERSEPWAEWVNSVSLTKEEAEEIRFQVLEQPDERQKIRSARQLARINRIIACSNRSVVPYSERYCIYKA